MVEKSSPTISDYLNSYDPEKYKDEKERRKIESIKRKRNKKKVTTENVDYELIKRQHYIDVGVLSYERVR